MTTDRQSSTPHYWYGTDADRERAIGILERIRAYSAADAAMQRRSEKTMRLNENDISALRYLLRANERGISVGPKELGDYLGVQSSSVTVLLDRLEEAGHVRRTPSPFDRRALIIVPTVPTDELHAAILGGVRQELVEVAASLTEDEASIVADFMDRLRDAVDRIDKPEVPASRARGGSRAGANVGTRGHDR
jgi:DNA-binding MarR family transcriptional regulator